ncbi:MAG: hypothetical protein IT480_06535 [Gammaproteobacteria bacterium]|nr:hypothetical protein [Gammaproteobacteria bacterium]
MPGGRPPEPVPEKTAEAIIDWLASGKALREFCRKRGAPAWRTVYDWIDKDAEFAARIAQAREIGADAIAEETLEIIDTQAEIAPNTGCRDSAHVAWLRNRAWQRMQLLAKWNPKKYGEKVENTHLGPGGGALRMITETHTRGVRPAAGSGLPGSGAGRPDPDDDAER